MRTHRTMNRHPLGIRLWFGGIALLIACVWIGAGYLVFRVASDPDGAGRVVGRIIGGAVEGVRDPSRKQPED